MTVIRSILERLGFRPKVRAMPTEYRGIRFASTLEADWAATFDDLRISWSYEPIALRLSDGQIYRCDFWLRAQRVWCEVKGPHDLRIDKPRRLADDIGSDGDDWRAPLVLICREPQGPFAVVERTDGERAGFFECSRCGHYSAVDLLGAWQCRVCGEWQELSGGTDNVVFARTYRSADRSAA